MGIDDQRRTLDAVGQVQAARNLPVRPGQRQVTLVVELNRTLAEKRADAILRGADRGSFAGEPPSDDVGASLLAAVERAIAAGLDPVRVLDRALRRRLEAASTATAS